MAPPNGGRAHEAKKNRGADRLVNPSHLSREKRPLRGSRVRGRRTEKPGAGFYRVRASKTPFPEPFQAGFDSGRRKERFTGAVEEQGEMVPAVRVRDVSRADGSAASIGRRGIAGA
jgi:hypothetical protein